MPCHLTLVSSTSRLRLGRVSARRWVSTGLDWGRDGGGWSLVTGKVFLGHRCPTYVRARDGQLVVLWVEQTVTSCI
jgi:hypothetical protein